MQQRSGLRQTPGRGAGAAEGSRSVCRFSRGPPGPTIGAGAPQQPHHGRSSSSGSGSGSRAKQQQQHDGAGTEPPALSVLLPNGRQFQLQMVVARDGQDPTWRFAGLSGVLSLAPSTMVTVSPADTAADEDEQLQDQQRQQLPAVAQLVQQQLRQQQPLQARALPTAGAAGDAAAAAAAAADALAWSFAEQQVGQLPAQQRQQQRQQQQQQEGAQGAWPQRLQQEAAKQQMLLALEHAFVLPGSKQEPGVKQPQQQVEQQQPLPPPPAAVLPQQPPQQQADRQQQVAQQQQQQHVEQERELLASVRACNTLQELSSVVQLRSRAAPTHRRQQSQQQQQQQQQQRAGVKPSTTAAPAAHWTPAVTAAALQRLREMLPWQVVAQLKAADKATSEAALLLGRGGGGSSAAAAQAGASSGSGSASARGSKWQGPQRANLQPALPGQALAGTAGGHDSSSSSSSSSGAVGSGQQQQQQQPLPLGHRSATPQDKAPAGYKVVMHTYLRLMHLLQLEAASVPVQGLLAAALLAARLIGTACVATWHAAAHGYDALAEAAVRLQAGELEVTDAIQICYSYSHSNHQPVAMLQPLAQLVAQQPALLARESLTSLSHFTYCVTSCLQHLRQQRAWDQPGVVAAVLAALQDHAATCGEGRTYDLVMLLRHLCQLSPHPPADWERQLLPMLVGRMPDMPMQELSTVLHVATEWQLSCKQQLAEAAAALVAAAAGVPVVVAASGSSDGDDDASAGSLRRRQQQQPQGGFVSAILLQTADALGEQLLQVKQQAAAHRAGDAAAGTGSDDADGASTAAVLTATHQKLQRVQKHIARWRTVLAPVRITTSSNGSSSSSSVRALLDAQPRRAQQCRPLRGMLPRNVADAVVLLHRFCCCGYKPHPGLLGFLLRAAGQELHSMSLLQANMLRRALVWHWVDASACELVLEVCLQRWMSFTGPIKEDSSLQQGDVQQQQQQQQQQQHGQQGRKQQQALRAAVLKPQLFKLPYWQLKALLIAAGRLGPLAGEVRQLQHAEAAEQQGQEDDAGAGQPGSDTALAQHAVTTRSTASSSSTTTSDGGCGAAAAFIAAVLQQLSPAVLAGWRSDMVVALWWAAARLQVPVSPQLLQAGCTAVVGRMRQQLAARELPHLVWAAAVLQVQDAAFLQALCGRVAQCANQLSPSSIASAAWSLAQLRCPNTAVLGVLSQELLRPEAWAESHAVLRARTWQRPLGAGQQHRQQQQQQPQGAADALPQDSWGSVERPVPQKGMVMRPDRLLARAVAPQDGFTARTAVLSAHPRVQQLKAADVAKLAVSCCLAGWAPPHLFLVLCARAQELMPDMAPEPMAQLLWALGTANCRDNGLLHAAVERAALLGRRRVYASSRQPLVLLNALRALGLAATEADSVLIQEVRRLKHLEQPQQAAEQQPERQQGGAAGPEQVQPHSAAAAQQVPQQQQVPVRQAPVRLQRRPLLPVS